MPFDYFSLSLNKKHEATSPNLLAVGKNFTIKAKTNHNHVQHHSSQKTVYVCSLCRIYFKVTK